ncbi:MAG: GNAT family protein [Acetobacter sp.]|uniref:GNAT family N-acetyltransferase n=1 Tax=Acetobacter sp. TaxID=440 RepID=UPI0039EA023F
MIRVLGPGEDDNRVSVFLARELNVLFHRPFVTMGIERDGEIIAGMLFNNFTGHDIHVTIAGTGWTRRFLRAFGRYLFDHLRVERFTGITEKQNVVDIVERIGGQREGVMRNHFGPGRDGIVLGVLKDEYRYRDGLKPQNTERVRNGPSAV